MTGIVLCGGQSLRMGSDKGLLKPDGKTWAQASIDKLAILDIPVKISVNISQYPDYAAIFPTTDLIADNTSLPIRGPLLGVLSSHVQNPIEDLFVLACDMPMIEPFLLKELYRHYLLNPNADAHIFTNDAEPEPLCGIYTAKGLTIILAMLENNQLKRQSMKFTLDHLEVNKISIPDEQKKYFRNVNAHAELNGQ